MLLTRRSLFGGLAAFVAAPAIVRVDSLMAVKPWDLDVIAIHDANGRLWRLPEGLAIRQYPFSGFGFSVPPGAGPLFAVHRPSGAAYALRSRSIDKARTMGWVPLGGEGTTFTEDGVRVPQVSWSITRPNRA